MPRSMLPGLGDLERAVMEHLWAVQEAGGGPLTVREVHATVGTQRDLAYTTVMTVLDRLTRKGLLTQERAGRAFRYAVVATRHELTAQTMRETLGALQAPDRRTAMLHFLDDASPQELAEVKAVLAEIEQRSVAGASVSAVETRSVRPTV